MKIGCVVLAAGNARRFGSNKLKAEVDGESLIHRALEAVPAEKFDKVVVVTQYPEVMRLAGEFHFAAIHNPHPDYGISHTIELGLTALRDCDGVLFLVSDQPWLKRDSAEALVALWAQNPGKIAAMAHRLRAIGIPWVAQLAVHTQPQVHKLPGQAPGSLPIQADTAILPVAEANN